MKCFILCLIETFSRFFIITFFKCIQVAALKAAGCGPFCAVFVHGQFRVLWPVAATSK